MAISPPELDLIAIGRSSVDLYGQQIGARLEDMSSFSKAVGGCPANIAIGTARLGLKSGLITRVGDEAMGRFIREQLQREGVDVRAVHTDPARLTALVLLGVRDDHQFPLIFVRENCADAALDESDIHPDFIATAAAIVVTGTHFATPNTAAAQRKAISIARANERKVVFDIDYRPNLWGLAGHGAGEERYIKSDTVTAHLQAILPDCDLIVGTEEEIRVAGGSEDTLAALACIRSLAPQALIVCKRGPMGCVLFPGAIPDDLDKGLKGPGFPVDVYNVLGAGDAFMSGFLRGWLRGEDLVTCCTFANACGAFAVSRLLCSTEIPTFSELQHFLKNGSKHRALRKDASLNHIHFSTTRRKMPGHLMALAIDHRSQMEDIAKAADAETERIAAFKLLALQAALNVAEGREGFGMLLDDRYGRNALFKAEGTQLWIGRPVEAPGSRPLDFDVEQLGSLGAWMNEWPATHCAKCLCFYHPDDKEDLRLRQQRELLRFQNAARRGGHEIMIEIIAGKHGPVDSGTLARALTQLYTAGLNPDWWKLEAQSSSSAWSAIGDAITSNDPYCRGVVMLGLDAPEADIVKSFDIAAKEPIVKGFAIGRTIFGDAARAWFAGQWNDQRAIDEMAHRYGRLCEAWSSLKREARV